MHRQIPSPLFVDDDNYHLHSAPIVRHSSDRLNVPSSPSSSSSASTRRARSSSPLPIRHRRIIAPMLSVDQRRLLKRSWQRIPKSSIGKSIYYQLIVKCPEARDLFGHDSSSSADRHARHFADIVQCAIENLDNLETALDPWLAALGSGHAGFAISSRHWDAFGESIVDAINQWIRGSGSGKCHRETIRAWNTLATYLADRLGLACMPPMSPIITPKLKLLTLAMP